MIGFEILLLSSSCSLNILSELTVFKCNYFTVSISTQKEPKLRATLLGGGGVMWPGRLQVGFYAFHLGVVRHISDYTTYMMLYLVTNIVPLGAKRMSNYSPGFRKVPTSDYQRPS